MPKLANLFSGIIYDGYTGAVMRYVDKGCRLDGKVRDWRYLQSDITRLKPDVKGQTWPYTHFEGWTLNFLRNVDWSTLTEKQPHDQSVGLRTEKAELAAKVKKLRKDLDKVIKNFISDETSPILQKAVKANATEIAEQLESTEEQLKNITTALERLASERSAMSEGIDEFRALISAGDPHARIRLQTELRRRIKSITLFRHGHPMLIAKDVHWPAVEIIYANGHRQITVTSQLGTAEHHARRQTRDPATGAFIKKPKD